MRGARSLGAVRLNRTVVATPLNPRPPSAARAVRDTVVGRRAFRYQVETPVSRVAAICVGRSGGLVAGTARRPVCVLRRAIEPLAHVVARSLRVADTV